MSVTPTSPTMVTASSEAYAGRLVVSPTGVRGRVVHEIIETSGTLVSKHGFCVVQADGTSKLIKKADLDRGIWSPLPCLKVNDRVMSPDGFTGVIKFMNFENGEEMCFIQLEKSRVKIAHEDLMKGWKKV